jgi:hypothetical protein
MEPRQAAALSLIADLLVSASRELDSMGHHLPAAQVDYALLLISEILTGPGEEETDFELLAQSFARPALTSPEDAAAADISGLSPEDVRLRADALLDRAKALLGELGIPQAAAFADMAQLRLKIQTGGAAPEGEHDRGA